MTAAAQHHTLLKIGGAAAAAFAGYEFLYKPWKAAQDAAALAAAGTGINPGYTSTGGGGGGLFSLPYITSPSPNVGVTPSNLDPGAAVGGPIGYCMHKKGWTQTQCTQRYNAIVSAYQAGVAALQALQSGTGAAGTQAQIDATKAALANAQAQYNAAVAASNPAMAQQWLATITAAQADIASLTQLLTTIPGRVASYQHDLAGLVSDFQNLFGIALGGVQTIAA